MKDTVQIPVSVKCRIGVDNIDSDEALLDFIGTIADAGCSCFILHARIAILDGLSPKQNREIPPLNYPRVYKVKQQFPDLEIVINGGIKTLAEAHEHLQQVDGVMLGREAYQQPYKLAEVDREFFHDQHEIPGRLQILEKFLPYVASELKQGTSLHHISRHILGLFHGQPSGKQFRRFLSENAYRADADLSVLKSAMHLLHS